LEGWITSILDKNGTPKIISYMPNDDSTLTVIKGSNRKQTVSANGIFDVSADPAGFVKDAGGALKLKYFLTANEGTIELPKEPETLDDSVVGTFAGFQGRTGEFIMTRRL
jgi:hypothetical protein